MAQRPSQILAASVALSLAAFVAGCGDDTGTLIRQDGGSHIDGLVPQPDTQVPPPDTARPPVDVEGSPDSGGQNTEATDAGAEASPVAPTLDAGNGPEAQAPPPVTVVVLPDTQYYAAAYPDVFAGQTSWILGQKASLNIAAVLHVGDIVDGDTPAQWTVANSSMRVLDGLVPYVVVPGNHDTDGNRKTLTDNYFSPASMPWITGTMVAGQIENSYALLDIGPQQWLVVGLEFGPRDAVVAWADGILKKYPTTPAILVTHAYLYSDGNRYDINATPHQSFIPQDYHVTESQGINDGEMLWQKLVLPNSNLRLVFCGHQTGWARLTSTRPDGTSVHQMLSDYQWYAGENFGRGYLRVVQFDYGKRTIGVRTYSPYLDQSLTDDANQFSLEMNF
jgi:hypothetical protein